LFWKDLALVLPSRTVRVIEPRQSNTCLSPLVVDHTSLSPFGYFATDERKK
jgi:hypothetical protein